MDEISKFEIRNSKQNPMIQMTETGRIGRVLIVACFGVHSCFFRIRTGNTILGFGPRPTLTLLFLVVRSPSRTIGEDGPERELGGHRIEFD